MRLAPWAEDVVTEYLQLAPSPPTFLENTTGPYREYYPTDKAMYQEILTQLYQVGGGTLGSDVTLHLVGGLYQCFMPDYACSCQTNTLIMVPINYWQNSHPFKYDRTFVKLKN